MALDVDTLLKPISEEQPAGEDLSYDNDRASLEQSFEVNDAVPEDGESDGGDKDWRSIIKLIESQFSRSKDVWLATYLCRAGARSGSLETVEVGAEVLAGLFEQYWETVHPQLDDLGLPGRKAPCDSLAARGAFLAPLERTILIAHPRMGAFSGADLERFRSQKEAADGYGMFRAALDELGEDSLREALQRLQKIEDALRRADVIFTREAGGEPSPNFGPTYAVLQSLKQGVQSFIPDAVVETNEAEEAVAEGGAGARPQKSFGGAVASRQDVRKALTSIVEYYRQNEPSHPVQFLAQRAMKWIDLDFMTLLKDIAPAAISDAQGLLNFRAELEEGG